jgi:hypothetical protein
VSPAARLLVLGLRFYQVALGPYLGGQCRFHPSCSAYAIEALQTRGALAGTWLAARRLLRCHPLGGAGYDPLPKSRDVYHFRKTGKDGETRTS